MKQEKPWPHRIWIAMGEVTVAMTPAVVSTSALGSCLLIVLYDPLKKIGGIAHVLVPDSEWLAIDDRPEWAADSAIRLLIDKMVVQGAEVGRLSAKLIGGASLFGFQSSSAGLENIRSARATLGRFGIPIVAEDVGGAVGRSAEFFSESGKLVVRYVGKEPHQL